MYCALGRTTTQLLDLFYFKKLKKIKKIIISSIHLLKPYPTSITRIPAHNNLLSYHYYHFASSSTAKGDYERCSGT